MGKVSTIIGIIILTCVWQTLTCFGCNVGYWGATCDNVCPGHCVTCTHNSGDRGLPCITCVPGQYSGFRCNVGYWGATCGNVCPANCVTCTQDSVDNGLPCTSCVRGKYSGTEYDYSDFFDDYDDCRHDCRDGCTSCVSYDNCTECVDGRYGPECRYGCYSGCEGSVCDIDGKCSCKTGFTSRFCKDQPSCTNDPCVCCKNNKCEVNNGNYSCTDGCKDGIWGEKCNRECPSDCETCTQDSGDSGRPCTSCVRGKYSGRVLDHSDERYYDDCSHDCRYTCVSCASFNNCTECVDGRYGTECQYSCYSGCEGGLCDKIDGKCTCKTGFTSRFCKDQPSCTNTPCACCKNNKCETNNGSYCTDGCINGVRGDTCDNECPTDCETCTQDSRDRRPCTSCVPGKYSGRFLDTSFMPYHDDCRYDCLDSCVSCASYYNCIECVDGRYGTDCRYDCYSGCEGGVCDKIDGKCKCKTGYTSRWCQDQSSCTNTPCACCKNNKCETNNYCTDGCIDSVRGDKCDNECPINCVTCTQNTNKRWVCTSCVSGQYIGRLRDSREEPYYDDCYLDCTARCLSCTSYKNCTECVDGSYGTECQFSCYSGCEGGQCDKMDGKCTCKTGYASRFCKGQPSCTNNTCACCKDTICETNNDNLCTDGCIDGVWGNACDNNCFDKCETCTQGSENSGRLCTSCVRGKYIGHSRSSSQYYDDCRLDCRSECVSCTVYDNCTECVKGRYGTYCHYVCSTGCEGGICNKTDGSCSCINGRYGTQCDNDCGNGCHEGSCDQTNGSCSCKTGFSGDKCCVNNNNCITCSSHTRCSLCKSGFSGDKCCIDNNNCETCSSNTKCSVCKSGYSGDKCCLNNYNCETCSSNTQCSGCKSGYSGNKCCVNNNICENCSSNTQCSVCKSGYSGDKCCVSNEKCLTCVSPSACSNCKPGYDRNTNCNECLLNKYGPNCSSDCNSNCLNKGKQSKCYDHNGTCVFGCQDGFYGDKCDLRCHQNCRQFTCSRVNGKCSHGCQDGFTMSGSDCIPDVTAVSNDDGDFPLTTLGVAFGVVVVVVLIMGGIVVFLIKRRNHLPQCCSATTNGVTQGPEDIQLVAVNAGDNETTEVCIDGKISYFPGEVLGHGLHGVVYKGRYGRFERKTVAVKIITCSNAQDAKNTHTELQNIYKEIKAMEILAEDTHIIQLFDSYINTNSVYLVFSYAMGTMVDYVTNAPWQILLTSDDVVRGIVDGLNFTHTKNIVHRDLKPANIFIIEHEVSRLKVVIGDFGQAKATTGNMFTFTGNFGSNAYTAPEIWTAMSDTATTSVGTQFHKASDVFPLGLVAYYTISLGKHPFGNEMNAQVTISRGDLPTFTDIANLINSVAYEDMLKGMLKNNPNDRPSMQVVSEHPALYTSDKMIKYFGLKSDEFESKIRAGTKNTNLLEDPNLIPNGNWMNRLPVNLRTYLRSYKLPNRASPLYKGHEKEVRFLLRAIRNTAGHHQAYPNNTQAEMGIYPEGHVALWLTVCPGLLMHVYNKL